MSAGAEHLLGASEPCWFWVDRGPLPEVVEAHGADAWDEFLACCEAYEANLEPLPGVGGRHHVLRVDDTMRIAALHGRVCPIPGAWKRLYLVLASARKPRHDRAPLPLSPLEWSRTTDVQKRARLRELAMWAQRHGALRAMHGFFSTLPERDWHHLDVGRWPELRLN